VFIFIFGIGHLEYIRNYLIASSVKNGGDKWELSKRENMAELQQKDKK
jgi:hypothetical protein